MKARASACPPSLLGALSVMHLPPEVPVRCLLMAHNFDYQSTWHLGTKVCAGRAEMCTNEWGGARRLRRQAGQPGMANCVPACLPLCRAPCTPTAHHPDFPHCLLVTHCQEREAYVYSMLHIPLNSHTRSLCEHGEPECALAPRGRPYACSLRGWHAAAVHSSDPSVLPHWAQPASSAWSDRC